MTLKRLSTLLSAVLALSMSVAASASGPAFWTIATASDFLKGTSDGVFVSLEGVLTAGPELTSRLTSTPAQIWSVAEGADGTLWAGTGGDGRVLRVRPGAGQREETAFDSGETNIFALAISGGRVFAASAPDGKVYVIEADGTTRPFFDPTEKYIWALATDNAGRLWVGAGNPAVIYRVDASGTGTVVYRPPAGHVVSLMRDNDGRMLAGTESPGRLYRFDSTDRPFVLLDSGLAELRAISIDASGVIFAAAISRGDDGSPAGGESASIAATIVAPSATASTSSTSTSTRKSTLYRIETNGSWEAVWDSADIIYDIASQPDGSVLAATGPEGRLYKVDQNRQVLLLTGVDAKQITRFSRGGRATTLSAFATANPGRVIAVGTREQSPANYVSPVRDSKSVSTWGLVRWDAVGPVVIYTRSGNTEKPDESWSEWAGPYARREGEVVKSPAARFIQWKAVLTRPTSAPAASLTAVTLAYLPRNSRPEVTSVTVHPPGVVFQRPFSSEEGAIAGLDDVTADARRPAGDPGPNTPAPGRRMFQKGLQTIAWKAEDADSDHLSYVLQFRREGDSTWRDLKRAAPDGIFVWDTTSVADGRYVVRVSASDDPSNAADRALVGLRESDPIVVDNTPPVVTTSVTRQGTSLRLVVRVHDAISPIAKLDYSLDGGPWQLAYPTDGLADSPDEQYEIPLANEADAARMIVRAMDLLQNSTSKGGA